MGKKGCEEVMGDSEKKLMCGKTRERSVMKVAGLREKRLIALIIKAEKIIYHS